MKPDTSIPKDYRPIFKTIDDDMVDHPAIGYDTDGQAEAACDSYRLHWENDPIRPKWREIASKPADYTGTYYVDKIVLDWLKVAVKIVRGGRTAAASNRIYQTAMRLDTDAMRVTAECDFGAAAATFSRPIPVPDEWRKQYGIDAQFCLEALQFVTRGKRQEITVTTHGPMIQFHNCTRHALVMPKRVKE